MGEERVEGIQGWLLVYLIGSIPVLLFFSVGLSGWFFEYPIGLWVAILLLLASPLVLVLLKCSEAPQWNIAGLWIASILITVRIMYGLLFQRMQEGLPLTREELLGALPMLLGIVIFALGWATVWTKYFQESVRVRNTFGQ